MRARAPLGNTAEIVGRTVEIPAPPVRLTGDLWVPPVPVGLVLFACCGDACRLRSRNRQIAGSLNERGFATLLLDLLAPGEQLDGADAPGSGSLGKRLISASRWAMAHGETQGLPLGYLSAPAAAAAALCAAAELGDSIGGVVSRGGRPDVTCDCLDRVMAPTLLIVGADRQVHALNEQAADRLCCPHEVREIPGATQLFDEPGAPNRIAAMTAAWLTQRLPARAVTSGPPGSRAPAKAGVGASGFSPDNRRSDWAYIPWTRVKSRGGSRWLAS